MPGSIVTFDKKKIHIPTAVRFIIVFVGSLSLTISLIYTIDLCVKSSINDMINIPFMPFITRHPEYLATAKGVVVDLGKVIFSAIGFAYLRRGHFGWASLLLPPAILGAVISILATTGAFHSTEDQAESSLRESSSEYIIALEKVNIIKERLKSESSLQKEKLSELKSTKYKTKTQQSIDESRNSSNDLSEQLSVAQNELNNTNPRDKTAQQSLYDGIQKTLEMIPFLHINADIPTIKNIFVFTMSLLIDWVGIGCFMVADFSFGIKFHDEINSKPTAGGNDPNGGKKTKDIENNKDSDKTETPSPAKNYSSKSEVKNIIYNGTKQQENKLPNFQTTSLGFISQETLQKNTREPIKPLSGDPAPSLRERQDETLEITKKGGSIVVAERRKGKIRVQKIQQITQSDSYSLAKEFVKKGVVNCSVNAVKNHFKVGHAKAKDYFVRMQKEGIVKEVDGGYELSTKTSLKKAN